MGTENNTGGGDNASDTTRTPQQQDSGVTQSKPMQQNQQGGMAGQGGQGGQGQSGQNQDGGQGQSGQGGAGSAGAGSDDVER